MLILPLADKGFGDKKVAPVHVTVTPQIFPRASSKPPNLNCLQVLTNSV